MPKLTIKSPGIDGSARRDQADLVRTLVVLAVLFTVVVVIAAMPHDDYIRDRVAAARGPTVAAVWQILSRLGKADWTLIPSGLAMLALAFLRPRFAATGRRDLGGSLRVVTFFFSAIAVTGLSVVIVKYSLGFPRPSVWGDPGPHFFAMKAAYASFPSGHSTSAAALAMVVTLIWPPAGWLMWPFAMAIGLSRIMLNAHHLSDVLAGLAFGGWGTVLIASAFARHHLLFTRNAAGWPTIDRHDRNAFVSDVGAFFRSMRPRSRTSPIRPSASLAVTALDATDAAWKTDMSSLSVSGMVSVVIPAKDEADNLAVIIPEMVSAMDGRDYEIIVVDDGSTDATGALLARLAGEGVPLRHVRHALPCGQSAAVRTGVLTARGEIVATIDGDGQNDPAYIPTLVDALVAAGPGCGIAAGQRVRRTDGFVKGLASRFANWLRNAILKDGTRDTGCGLKAVRRDLFLKLPFFHGWHRYLPALARREGFSVTHIDVVDRSRLHGSSNYGIFDRGLQGILDLAGVWWLNRRIKRLPTVTEIDLGKGQ